MAPLAPLLAMLLASGLPAASSLKLQLVRRDNRSALGSGPATSDDDDKPSSDDDDTPAPPPRRRRLARTGSLAANVAMVPAPVIGSTEMISPWGPEELALQMQFKTWPGSWNLRVTYEDYMKQEGEMIEGFMDKYGMADTEVIALIAYSKGDYEMMNNVLRGIIKLDYEPEEVVMTTVLNKLADKALERLPSIGGEVLWRGTLLSETARQKLENENFFYDPGFLSTSSDLVAAFGFAMKDDESVLFQIVCPPPTAVSGPQCKGKSIMEFSEMPFEQEVLFPPGSKFAKVGEGWFEFPTGDKYIYTLEPAF